MSSFDVAIINHNTAVLLKTCLRSVICENPDRVIVVDNGSVDGSAAMVRCEFGDAVLLENRANPGYGAAANQAIYAGSSKYVLLLNSDTVLPRGALVALGDYLDHHPEVAIVGPRLIYPGGALQRSTYPIPTLMDVFLDASNLGKLAQWIPGLRERCVRTWSQDRAREVPSVLGAALAIRREAFYQVQGFDKDFFMYYEEVDICYRLTQIGWKIHYAPVTEIIHVGGASTRQYPAEMAVQLYTGMATFYRRHFSPARLVGLALLVRMIAIARLVRDRFRLIFTRDGYQRAGLETNLFSWQRLIFSHWERVDSFGPRHEP